MHSNDSELMRVALAAFPNYTGRTFQVRPFTGPMRLDSYWSGGSRSYYAAVNLGTLQVFGVPENGTPFMPEVFQASILPLSWAIVEHCIFCGKDLGLRVYVNAENLAKMLPEKREMTWAENVVLAATSSLKSSYGGISDFRQHEARQDTGITPGEWAEAKASCQSKGWLNKAGAITNDGRNALEAMPHRQLFSLRREAAQAAPLAV